jgi:GntR family transcriptional regulator
MYVTEGARKQLLKDERRRFIEQEWPRIAATIDRLGLDIQSLLDGTDQPGANKKEDSDD